MISTNKKTGSGQQKARLRGGLDATAAT